ncbi:MAG: tRNA threonylcarbamoyladenosine biosynthesis protein TsaB [uncultured Nocardioidaceae bacterium]|uniref:tRNA threonylcarbamoyladenosine biosynthesis protein TsaB n=1 Tax=uncultured Nocardioidaceae bacterium TaxID=253824 RepID=A0A6J4L2C0_9ACTN|nr:MAG: tRNA threonylcarbamoyladenosine biosynthesis protein TsaB [uncultured Nocardioidaceae bacterium]
MLLALDTATPVVTVAVHDGHSVLASSRSESGPRHGELLAPAIAGVLKRGGVDRRELTEILVGIGPGPYTGLRVGVVTARTLGEVLDVPVHGVVTLDIVAAAQTALLATGHPFVVATDARRREVFWAKYEGQVRVEGPAVDRPADLAARLDGVPVVGRGARLYAELLAPVDGPDDPSAEVLAEARISGAVQLVAPQPQYLRRPDVSEPSPRKRVL